MRHHIPDDLLMSYATGALPEAFSLVVATHISLCAECRAHLCSFDAVGGALLEEETPDTLDDAALMATFDRIDQTSFITPRVQKTDPVFPSPLLDYIGPSAKVPWRSIGGGVKQAMLECDANATARLLYIPAGTAVPDHGHNGLEMTLVLQGAFSDDVDRFARGDVEIGDEDLDHTPIADTNQPCICLAATDAPLRFKSFLPRLVQPFIGI